MGFDYLEKERVREDKRYSNAEYKLKRTGVESYRYIPKYAWNDIQNAIGEIKYNLKHEANRKRKNKLLKKLKFYEDNYPEYLV